MTLVHLTFAIMLWCLGLGVFAWAGWRACAALLAGIVFGVVWWVTVDNRNEVGQ